MNLFTREQRELLFANSKNSSEEQVPVACLYWGGRLRYTFLLTGLDPEDKCTAYGLCDFNGKINVQYVNLRYFMDMATEKGCWVQVDDFYAERPLSDFRQVAEDQGTLIGLTNHWKPKFIEAYEKLNRPVPPA